jgi:hypothetical protein
LLILFGEFPGFRVLCRFIGLYANSSVAGADPSSAPKLEFMPVNPKYLEYWEKAETGERPAGLAPSPITRAGRWRRRQQWRLRLRLSRFVRICRAGAAHAPAQSGAYATVTENYKISYLTDLIET